MSGLLDPKKRIIDAIITPEGRRQLMNGGMNIRFASFSDIGSAYESNDKMIYEPESIKINLESFSTRNDTIMQSTDESGRFIESAAGPIGGITFSPAGMIVSSSTEDDYGTTIAMNSIEFLKNQMMISTFDTIRNDKGLFLSKEQIQFSIQKGIPFKQEPKTTSLNDADSLFCDKRLKNIGRFKYLPPVQQGTQINEDLKPLGIYPDFSEVDDISQGDFYSYLKTLEMHEIELSRLTENHDIAIQVFESTDTKIQKLDIIKYGKIETENGKLSDLYFLGKLYFDEFDVPTFINIFTMVIE